MSVGITETEFILAHNYNRNVNALRSVAQSIIDDKDREIIRLRRQLTVAQARIAELEAESLDTKMEMFKRRRRHLKSRLA